MLLDQYVSTEETLRRLLRSRICTKCLARRGLDNAARKPDEVLACQAQCPIFLTLPTLTKYVDNLDSLVGSYDGVVHAVAASCPTCDGDVDWRSRHRRGCRPECPFRIYGHEVAHLLEEVGRRLHG